MYLITQAHAQVAVSYGSFSGMDINAIPVTVNIACLQLHKTGDRYTHIIVIGFNIRRSPHTA